MSKATNQRGEEIRKDSGGCGDVSVRLGIDLEQEDRRDVEEG
jgi:hypothetical protein